MRLRRYFLLLLFFASVFGISSGHSAGFKTVDLEDNQYSPQSIPNHDTPPALQEAWLQFHQHNLCQKVDAVFEFPERKMEVWVNSQEEKDRGILLRLLKPLQKSYQIGFHTTQSAIQIGSADIKTPPPSFWENSELTSRLRDSFLSGTGIFDQNPQLYPTGPAYSSDMMDDQSLPMSAPDIFPASRSSSTILYQRRLLMFARNTLEYGWKIKRYVTDLPSLAYVAYDPAEAPELRHQALAVCRQHAQELQKYEEKLNKNLLMALPTISGKQPEESPLEKSMVAKASPFDIAVLLTKEAQGLSTAVLQFMYPQNKTVTLADLQNPPIIQSLATIQRITAEFRNSVE
jgi:hypothetical protein